MPRTVKKTPEPADPVAIDPDRLDLEVFDQSRRARNCGERLADAELDAKRAKARAELAFADLLLKIRSCPHEYGIDDKKAPPMDIVEACARTQPKYQEAEDAQFAAEHYRDYAKSEREAFRDRKSMLEKAVELNRDDYRSEPRTAGDSEVAEFNRRVQRRHVRNGIPKSEK